MKKVLYLVGLIAILAACNKDNKLEPQNSHFEEGDEVTITVGVHNTGSNARRIDGYTRGDNDAIGGIGNLDFQWNKGDVITVTVGTESSVFHMIDLDETHKSEVGVEGSTNADDLAFGGVAYFRGKMPGNGENFTVTYGPEKVPSKQNYHYDGIGRGIMRFEATGCSLNEVITLHPKFAALRTAVAADFNYATETGASAWVGKDGLDAHPMISSLHLKAFLLNNNGTDPDFECDYIINKEVGGITTGDKISLFIIFVLPPAAYREIDVTPNKEGACYAMYNGEKVLEGTCENPICYALKETDDVKLPNGIIFEEGEYQYLGAPIDILYTYKALKSPQDFNN